MYDTAFSVYKKKSYYALKNADADEILYSM